MNKTNIALRRRIRALPSAYIVSECTNLTIDVEEKIFKAIKLKVNQIEEMLKDER